MLGDDDALHFVGAFADAHQRSVAVITLDVEVGRVTVPAEDTHGFETVLDTRFRREQFRHARLEVATLASVVLARGLLDEQAGSFDPGRHIREF